MGDAVRVASVRWSLLAGGFLCAAGGFTHPRGASFDVMLGDPLWVPSHLGVLGGLALFGFAVLRLRRVAPLSPGVRLWAALALAGVALEVVEMVFHTAAALDHANMVAGRPTPIFSTHMAIAMVVYPVFGVTVGGFIGVAAARGELGSRWAAPLGVVGALAYGFAPPLTRLFPEAGLGILFPMFLLFAIWLVVAGLRPGGRALLSVRAAEARS